MKNYALIALFLLNHLANGLFLRSATKKKQSTNFDFYVLSMSYQPEFCYQHRYDDFAGCDAPLDFWRGSLTLHGLWPEFKDGEYPSTCSNEKFNPETVDDLGEDRFNTFWPNVKAVDHSRSHYSFWEHEWTKHGTCTGLSQDEYFDTALKHFLPSPNIIRENYGSTITKSDLLDAYRQDIYSDYGDVVLVCSGDFLSEVRICVGRTEDGEGSQRIACIPEVIQEGNCGDHIMIAKFYVDDELNKGLALSISLE
jgi:ribonuclease T2